MATGLLRPDAGTARVLGHDVWADPASAKAVMGVSPDGMRLFEQLSGRELLTYVGALRRMPRDVTAERAAELLTVLDLADDASTVVADYSAGMVKKISLAAALIHAPRLLVLDEPFEAVDPVSGPDHPHDPAPVRRQRRHRRHVEPRHGAGRGPVRPGGRHRRRAGCSPRTPSPASPGAGRCTRGSSSWSGRPTSGARASRGWADRPAAVRHVAHRDVAQHPPPGLVDRRWPRRPGGARRDGSRVGAAGREPAAGHRADRPAVRAS